MAIQELFPEIRDLQAPPDAGRHGYFRRSRNERDGDGNPHLMRGWIVTGAMTFSNVQHFTEKGFERLFQYGTFVIDTADPRSSPKARDTRGVPWNSALEPWKQILQLNGAKEFPVSQVIAFRWHIRPPYRGVAFPQLEGLDITDYQCPECEKGLFSAINPRQAATYLRTHLISGINEQHKYTPRDIRELGQDWKIDFETRRVRREPVVVQPDDEPLETIGEDLSEPGSIYNEAFRCEKCNEWAPLITVRQPAGALRFHLRRCKGPAGDLEEAALAAAGV